MPLYGMFFDKNYSVWDLVPGFLLDARAQAAAQDENRDVFGLSNWLIIGLNLSSFH